MDQSGRNGLTAPAADLAKAPPFDIGPLKVEPATRRISIAGRSEMLEPRVMRVLVALGEMPGLVLSRDDLIELCWDGQIVTDNAINRVISLLRRALEDLASSAVRLETITKVGFRIVVDSPADGVAASTADVAQSVPTSSAGRSELSRRALAGGAVAACAIAATAGYVLWSRPKPHVPDLRALDLYRRGQLTQKTGEPGSMRQAMAFYKQAIEIDPDYADAWGAIAIGYRHGGDGFVKEPREAYPRLVRSAAGRALALDPDQPDAKMALATIYSDFGKWGEREGRLRAIVQRTPGYWYGWAQLDLLMQDVGRFDEAIGYRQKMLALDPMVPVAWAYLARGLHYAGRDHEADIALDRAFAKWPGNPILWGMRFQILIGGKRYAEAAAFARDPRSRPEEFPEEAIEANVRLADALANRKGAESILATIRDSRRITIEAVPSIVPIIAELGDASMAFARLQAYFFGGVFNGRTIPPPDRVDARATCMLFSPPMLALKGDPRFGLLLQQTGLEAYWRQSGTQPDFRKG